MSISQDEVKKMAHLARLDVSAEQVADYAKNLSSILELVEQMNSVDTTGVEPMAHPLHMHQRLREDVVTEGNQREQLQSQAPAVEAGLFVVPKVIE